MPIDAYQQHHATGSIHANLPHTMERSNELSESALVQKNNGMLHTLSSLKNSQQHSVTRRRKYIKKASLYFILLLSKIDTRRVLFSPGGCNNPAIYRCCLDTYPDDHFSAQRSVAHDAQRHVSAESHDAHALAYGAVKTRPSWFTFSLLPMAEATPHAGHVASHTSFNFSSLFQSTENKNLFPYYNKMFEKNHRLQSLATHKKNAILTKGKNAIVNYYNKFSEHHPSLKVRARRILQEKIKAKFNLDINPDHIYFMHFAGAIGCPDAFTGWCHLGMPIEWGALTRYLFTNFPADAQETIDSTNMWCGIYNITPNATGQYGKDNEIRLLPRDFINLVWDIDFYKRAKNDYTASFTDQDTYIKKHFMDFILNLAAYKPDNDATSDILAGVGLKKDEHVFVSLFDINGYQASNLFVFTNKSTRKVTLYMPHHKAKFLPFDNMFDMRNWIIHNCVDQAHRRVLASHFSLYNRQDGVIFDGIDKWLDTLSHIIIAEEHMDKICTRFTPLPSERFFAEMTSLSHERFLNDLDILIKSDAEVTRDIWERDIDAMNILPNPITPFISLGFHLAHALEGDSEQERNQAWNNLASDIVNLVLMVLMEKLTIAEINGYDFINTVKSDIDIGNDIPNQVFNDLLPTAEIALSELESRQTIVTADAAHNLLISDEVLLHIERAPTLDATLFSDLKPDNEGLYHYTQPGEYVKKIAILMDDKFYSLTPTDTHGLYYLENGTEVVLLDGVYHIRKIASDVRIKYTTCHVKRTPGVGCLHFSEGLNTLLESHLHDGMSEIDIGTIRPHDTFTSLYVNNEGKLFIAYKDVYFRVKESHSGFKILAKKRVGVFHSLLSRKTLAKFHFSFSNGMYYLNTSVENTMETLRCSKAAAELHHFNLKHNTQRDLITREEIYAIKSYGNMGFDPINDYMMDGMPKTNARPLNREQDLINAVKNIRSLLRKLPGYEGTVYRGGMLTHEELASLKPGDVITSKKFLSSSADMLIAKGYAHSRGDEGAFFTINSRHKGHPIGFYTMRIYEAEVLFEDHTLFVCTSVEGRNIALEELSEAESKKVTNARIINM